MRERTALLAILCAVLALIAGPSVLAFEPHEDAEIAQPVFSGLSLFRYYSGSLDFVLQLNPAMVEYRLEKMPFANIPEELKKATDVFSASGIDVANSVTDVYQGQTTLRTLVRQFRLEEAIAQANLVFARISKARTVLGQLEESVVTAGRYFNVSSRTAGSDLRNSYREVLEKIDRIREMLDLYEQSLVSSPIQLNLLKSTELTLAVEPVSASVGDTIHFEGVLTSENEPLAGREVNITLNASQYVTVRTEAQGRYEGTLRLPYWYVPELNVQAIFLPTGKDVGVYAASLSPIIKIDVLFYEAKLELNVDKKAYPGLETTVTGRFEYGQAPPLENRNVEIYLDTLLSKLSF